MDWEAYRKLFEEEALRQGRTPSFVSESLEYAVRLVEQNLPIIYDFSHLSLLLGFEEEALREAISNPADLYFSYSIPKRKVGYRRITEPVTSLMIVQRWILEHILNRVPPHNASMAFCKGRSIKHNAEPHVNRPMVLSLDVKEFFPSIGTVFVEAVFLQLGYSREVVAALTQLTVLKNGLPQGAPTSPAISNLVMRDADKAFFRYAQEHNIDYSRYADDLTFSGVFHVGDVVKAVRGILGACKLTLNETKTRLMLRHQRQEVTGVVVNERIQAPRKLRRFLRQEVYYIVEHGIEGHLSRRSSLFQNHIGYLRGLAEFVLFLNPADRDARLAVDVLGKVKF